MASVDDELILSGETRAVTCLAEECENRGAPFDVPVELPAVCGPCGRHL